MGEKLIHTDFCVDNSSVALYSIFYMKAKTTPIIIALSIPIVSVALAIGLIYFKKKNVSGLDDFPYALYIESPKSLQGNRYILNAQMDIQLAKTSDGRVVSVSESQAGAPLAVLVPSSLDVNISAKQRYEIIVRVGEGGKIIVESMQKY